ncbi:hypothetical protein R84B8_02437 [Treponema sp. R8-4-B8]
MKKKWFTVIITIISSLFLFKCEYFNIPMKEFIADSSEIAMCTDYSIDTPFHAKSVTEVFIPPDEVSKITITLYNPRNFNLKLALIGDNPSEKASVVLGQNRQTAVVTVDNPSRFEVFDLTVTMEVNGRPMEPYKLPKMECRYLNNYLHTLSVDGYTLNSEFISDGFTLSPSFVPDNTDYTVNFPEDTYSVTITYSRVSGVFSSDLIKYNSYEDNNNDDSDLTNTYTLEGLQPGRNTILIIVTADSGITNTYTLTVNVLVNAKEPVINVQPQNAEVSAGTQHSLSVTAVSIDGGILSYQWYSNTTESNSEGTLIPGATSAIYNFTVDSEIWHYYVVITNTNNEVTGIKFATVASDAITLTVNAQTPNITVQPNSKTIGFSLLHTLSVTANVTDGGTLSHQWYENTSNSNSGGTPISGEVNSAYNLTIDIVGVYYYYVILTNTNDRVNGTKTTSITSNVATLTVKEYGIFEITFTQITDEAPITEGPTIHRSEQYGNVEAILTVEDPDQYDIINWYIYLPNNLGVISGSGPTFTLSSKNTAYNSGGQHYLTLEVMKDGISYNQTIIFRVVQ